MRRTAVNNPQAFPQSVISPSDSHVPEGMTLLDFFAKEAPSEIPIWFYHKPLSKCPKLVENDIEDNSIEVSEWHEKDSRTRYFQWRWYYAQQMLKERENWLK